MLSKLMDRIRPVLKQVARYQYAIVGAIIVGLFVLTVNVINTQLSPDRNEDAYNEALLGIERVEFDEEAVKTIVRLRDLNVDVEAIFAPGRTNPFE